MFLIIIFIIIIFLIITLLIDSYSNKNKEINLQIQQFSEFQQESEQNEKVKVFIECIGLKTPGICTKTERTIEEYLNQGYKVISSQLIFYSYYKYTYTVMVKE